MSETDPGDTNVGQPVVVLPPRESLVCPISNEKLFRILLTKLQMKTDQHSRTIPTEQQRPTQSTESKAKVSTK